MKEKVLVLHGENTFNYGTFMMLISLISTMSKKGDYDFLVRFNSKEDYDRLITELDDESIQVTYVQNSKYVTKSIIDKLGAIKFQIIDNVNSLKKLNPDKIIILGGDDYSEYYRGWKIIFDLIVVRRLSVKCKTILVGQTMGPFHSWRKIASRWAFKNSVIITRDPITYEYLKNELNYGGVLCNSSDLAFLDLPLQKTKNRFKLKARSYVTVVPSGLWSHYSDTEEEYIQEWKIIIESLAELHPDKKIVFLPHVTRPSKSDDRKMVNLLKKSLKNNEDLIFINNEMTATEARKILGNGYLTITGRMHASISTFQMGIPAIPISYSVKYKGIIGRTLGLEKLICEKFDNKIVIEKVKYVDQNYNEITKQIKEKVSEAKDMVMDSFHVITGQYDG